MKILYITDRDLNAAHAEAVHVVEVVRSLSKLGHQLTLVSPVEPRSLSGITTVVTSGRTGGRRGNVASAFRDVIGTIASVRRTITNNKFDAIYVRISVPLLPLMPWLRSVKKDSCLLIEVNGIFVSELSNLRSIARPAVSVLERFAYRGADRIVAVSSGVQEFLAIKYQLHNITVIPNGANTDVFKPLDKSEARKRSNIDPDAFVVGFVGNVAPWHGVEVLLHSISHLPDNVDVLKVILVGGGRHLPAIADEVRRLGLADVVDVLGPRPHDEIPNLINACDCCVSPAVPMSGSDPGRNSLKVFEYLACGVPVVVSNLPGIAEVVRESGLGEVVPPGDEAGLAEALQRVYEYDDDMVERIRDIGPRIIRAHHSWDSVARGIVHRIQQLQGEARA